ncbi:MAG: prepilin peptidase [Candidatus Dormibacteria bacterium]
MLALVVIFAALLGGAIGSFAGVVSARGWRGSLAGRSHCDGCGRTLAWYELVPFVSFLALRGGCRTCHARIGWRPFGWEVAGGVVAVAVAVVVLLLMGRNAGG